MNPYVCSGCGAPFQKHNPESPGYLPRISYVNIGLMLELYDKQEAIRILEMAGIEIDSSEAEGILRDAKVDDDVISEFVPWARVLVVWRLIQQISQIHSIQVITKTLKRTSRLMSSTLPRILLWTTWQVARMQAETC